MNKLIWITGASSGIGKATAIEASKRGYRLALTARRKDKLEELKASLKSEIFIAPADVTNLAELESAYQAIEKNCGQIDILFANAGSHTPSSSKNFDVAKYKELFDLNFFGVLNCIELVLPQMRARKSGQIVGVSSVAGYRALPTAAAYGASKSALTYFLDSLRFDAEKHGISVSVVSPGFVKTELTDKNDFYMPFMIEASKAAIEIMNGIEGKKLEIHFPKRFTYILKFLRIIPFNIYHYLMARLVK